MKTPKRVGVLELTADHCRWPMGDPRKDDFHFCAAPKHEGKTPYCELHYRMSIDTAGVKTGRRRRTDDASREAA